MQHHITFPHPRCSKKTVKLHSPVIAFYKRDLRFFILYEILKTAKYTHFTPTYRRTSSTTDQLTYLHSALEIKQLQIKYYSYIVRYTLKVELTQWGHGVRILAYKENDTWLFGRAFKHLI